MNEPTHCRQERFWSRFADTFESQTEYVAGREAMDAIEAAIFRQGLLGRALELGCGNGTYTTALAQHASWVVATDLSDEMLAVSRKKLAHIRNVSLERADCLDLPYPDRSFDTVFMANLIHVIPEPLHALDESIRLIRKGGRLIVASFTADGMSPADKAGMFKRYLDTWGAPPENAKSFACAELTDILVQRGLIIAETTLLGHTTKALFIVAKK